MLEVENLSPFTRGFHYNGKELIFTAKQIRRDVPDSWLKPDGTIPYPGLLKLKRIIDNDTGDSKRVYIPKIVRDENFVNPAQEWEYIFINEAGDKYITTQLTKFCEEHNLNLTSIRNYIKQDKIYKGWKITKRKYVKRVMLQDVPEEDQTSNKINTNND